MLYILLRYIVPRLSGVENNSMTASCEPLQDDISAGMGKDKTPDIVEMHMSRSLQIMLALH